METYEFVDDIVGGVIPREYIPACDKGFKEQLTKGQLIGAPVVGVRCTVNDGAFHPVDSSEMAFRICAMTSIRENYQAAGPIILEPIMKVEVAAPDEFQGSVTGGLEPAPRRDSELGDQRRLRDRAGPRALLRNVRLLDRSALGHSGQG